MAAQPAKVTIMPGPGDAFRVRELESDCLPVTLGWFGNYDNAVDYIRDNYREEQACSPDEFRQGRQS